MMNLVLLAGLGGTLASLEATGQAARVLRTDLRAYCQAFEGVTYLGYGPDDRMVARRWLHDLTGFARFRVPSVPRSLHPWAWSLVMALARADVFRDASVVRVMSASGALPAYLAHRWWGVPYVVHVGYDAATVAEVLGHPVRARAQRWLRRLTLSKATAVTASRPGLVPEAILLENGVDVERFTPQRRTPGPAAVLYIGRLAREKNLDVLVRACRLASVRLILAGDGPERPALEALALAEDADVVFLGVQPHELLPTICATADLFALPSLTEGSPKALLEAMSCGLPCVVSPAATVVEHRKTGIVVPENDPEAWAAAFRHLARKRDLAQVYGDAARAYVVEHHDAKRILQAEVALVASRARRG